MNTKKVFVYVTGAVLATEIIIKHEEGTPHIPHEEHHMNNSGMGVNVYHNLNMQTATGATMLGSATLVTKY